MLTDRDGVGGGGERELHGGLDPADLVQDAVRFHERARRDLRDLRLGALETRHQVRDLLREVRQRAWKAHNRAA